LHIAYIAIAETEMDDFTIRPRDSASRAAPRRPVVSVRTDLAPSQSVTAAGAPATAHRGGTPADTGAHEALIGAQSQTLIDRERDISAHSPPRRTPDQALLRMRAYHRNAASEDPDQDGHADVEA
jgi:hypothetical protein